MPKKPNVAVIKPKKLTVPPRSVQGQRPGAQAVPEVKKTNFTQFAARLTPELILEAVEFAGVRCTGRVLQLNSMENRVYEAEIELKSPAESPSDSFLIVKFYRPGRWTKEQILEEHQFLKDLKAEDVPVVAPLKLENGSTVAMLETEDIYFAVFPKQGGRLMDEATEDSLRRMGSLLSRVHLIGARRPAKHRLALSPETYGRKNLEFLLSSGMITESARPRYTQLVESIISLSEPLFKNAAVQRVHGDCHIGNIIVGKKGLTLVDFDDMVTGPPVQDFWLVVPSRGEERETYLSAIISGYEQQRTFDRSSLNLIEPLRALRYVNYAAWIARRWGDPTFTRAFPQFGNEMYWQNQIIDLQEQAAAIQAASWGAPQY